MSYATVLDSITIQSVNLPAPRLFLVKNINMKRTDGGVKVDNVLDKI